jgi:hypothetical protein
MLRGASGDKTGNPGSRTSQISSPNQSANCPICDYGIVGVGHGEFLQSGGIEVLKKLREQKVSLLTSTITAKTRELKTSGL